MKSEATLSTTSLPESASGHLPCDGQDGQTIGQLLPAHALASLSARRAKELGLLMSGTYGPPSFTLFTHSSLSGSMVSRLRALTDLVGSTLYNLTWRARATPSGQLIYALRASALRTLDSDCFGWPTPTTRDHKDTGDMSRSMVRKDGKHRLDTLGRVVFGFKTQAGKIAPLNPALSRWLMGIPAEWDDCAPMETRSALMRRKQ